MKKVAQCVTKTMGIVFSKMSQAIKTCGILPVDSYK